MNQYGAQYPMYPGYQQGPPPTERRAKAVALTVAALAAVAAVTAGIVVWVRSDSSTPTGPSDATSAAAAPPAGTPAAVAYSYLRALADGDAAAALKASALAPPSVQYATRDVLRMQLQRAPITAISAVDAPAPGDTDSRKSVTLSARFGDQQSSVTLAMVKPQGSAEWQIPRAVITVAPLQPKWQSRIINVLTVAGIPTVEDASTSVFPGSAPVLSASPWLDVTATPMLLETLGSDASATWSPRAAINDRGRRATLDAIAFRLKSCFRPDLAKNSTLSCPPAPAGVELPKVTEVNPLTSSNITFGELDQSQLEMPVHGQVAYTLTVDTGSGPTTVPATAAVNATVNLSYADTDPYVDFI